MRQLYDPFLKKLVCNFSDLAADRSSRRTQALRRFREYFNNGRADADFAAIDGTCGKEQLSEMMVFYGASYAQNGTLRIADEPGTLSYARWTPSEDTSFVAYLPVPLNALSEFQDEDWLFRADDEERSTVATVHTGLMQLAEIYLAYKRLTSQERPPCVLLLDHSLSSILLSSDVMHLVRPYRPDRQTLGWIGAYIPRWGREFEPADGLVAHAHPMNQSLQVPSLRSNALAERLTAEITNFWQIGMTGEREPGHALEIASLQLPGVDKDDLRNRLEKASKRYGAFEVVGELIKPVVACR
ncbi:MAG: hypothetical protein H5T59_05950, partial [Anaerolineae bacterium]|nr:hypothetical protein [Anaerolineae bacterium]